MRIYDSVIEAIKETERELFEMGIDNHAPTVQDLNVKDNPDYDSKELLGYSYCITKFKDLNNIFEYCWPLGKASEIFNYCIAELVDRLSSTPLNPGRSWT